MGLGQDAVDRAFDLILSDDRRKLSADDEAAAKRLWRKVFSQVRDTDLLEAVQDWLLENRRGRPNIGEIKTLLQKRNPAAAAAEGPDMDLQWAISIQEAVFRGGEWAERIRSQPYQHTLLDAERVLRRKGYSSWQEAKGITTTQVTEVTWRA